MLGNTSTFAVEKSAPDALCMVFRVTGSSQNADLDSINPNSSLSDYDMIPVARSFNGYDWKRTAGPYAQSLDIACDDTECQLAIPPLSGSLDWRFVLMPFQHSVSEKAEISRFFHQTTFGPTMKMINEWDYNSGLSTEMSKWVKDQMNISVTPITSHREFFRRRVNYQISLGEEAAHTDDNKKQMFKVRNFCNAGARWTKYTFTTEDHGKHFTVTQQANGAFAIKKQPNLDLVSLVDVWQDELGQDLGEGTFQVLWRIDETQSGRVQISQNEQTKYIQNPEISIPLNDPNFTFLNLPNEESFSSTPIIAKQNIWHDKFDETLYLTENVEDHVCSSYDPANSANIVGVVGNSSMQLRYARYIELEENSLSSPNGGVGIELCSNPAMDWANDDSCTLSTEAKACKVDNSEKLSIGDAFVICGSDGEVGNDPFGRSIFQIPRTQKMKSNTETAKQRKSVWTMIALNSEDQLRQRVAWALSQILVITPNQISFDEFSEVYLKYYDIFVKVRKI